MVAEHLKRGNPQVDLSVLALSSRFDGHPEDADLRRP